MQDIIALQLLAADFKGTIYSDGHNCAICKAVKRLTGNNIDVIEYGRRLDIDSETFWHEIYLPDLFDEDAAIAESHDFDQTVVREIILNKEISDYE